MEELEFNSKAPKSKKVMIYLSKDEFISLTEICKLKEIGKSELFRVLLKRFISETPKELPCTSV